MSLEIEFTPLPLERLRDFAHRMKDEGWRFIQTHAATNGDNVDLYYSFMKDGKVVNYRIEAVLGQPVPSITDIFLAAFVFENEARELFGVDMRDIAIDFQGGLYAPAESEPMRFMTPEQKAAIDKSRKAAAAKAEKASAGSDASQGDGKAAASGFVMTPEKQAKLDAKLKDMDPAKAEKVRAALAAKLAASKTQATADIAPEDAAKPSAEPAKTEPKQESGEAAAVQAKAGEKDADLEAKLAMMDPEKAAKVRAAIAAKNGQTLPAGSADDADGQASTDTLELDAELEGKLAMMGAEKAAAVRAALMNRKSSKGGE